MEHPWHSLRCIASTILASSLVSATQNFLGDSPFPIAPPIANESTKVRLRNVILVPRKQQLIFKYFANYTKILQSLIA